MDVGGGWKGPWVSRLIYRAQFNQKQITPDVARRLHKLEGGVAATGTGGGGQLGKGSLAARALAAASKGKEGGVGAVSCRVGWIWAGV